MTEDPKHGPVRILTLTQTALEANCHLVACAATGEAIVIDCGEDADEVLEVAEAEELKLVRLLATHGHADHIGGFADLQEKTGLPLAIHPGDREMAESRQVGIVVFLGTIPPAPTIDEELVDGQEIRFGEACLRVMHTPGHSPGSVCFLGESILISGDTLFAGSVGRTDLPGGSETELRASLERIARLDPSLLVFPGHLSHTTLERELRTNPFLA